MQIEFGRHVIYGAVIVGMLLIYGGGGATALALGGT
jgi:hypothetical protein